MIHMIQMLWQEARSGQMHDLAHVLTQYWPAARQEVGIASLLIQAMQTGILREVDTHSLSTVQRKAFLTDVLFPDSESTED